MKIKRIILFLLFLQSWCSLFGQGIVTNGVFVSLKPTKAQYQLFCEKHDNKSVVNPFILGKTYEVDNCAYDLLPTNDTSLIYFSNKLLANIETNTTFGINVFSQEILNTNTQPQKLHDGASSFSATITGEGIFLYQNKDTNSSCVISTPVIDIELHTGKFYIKTTETKTVVAVINGSITGYTSKKAKGVSEGYALIAEPNEIGILEDSIRMSVEKFNISKVIDIDDRKNIIFIRENDKTIAVNID